MKELLEYLSAVQEAPINTFFFARQRRGERFTQIFREIHISTYTIPKPQKKTTGQPEFPFYC